MSILTSYIQPKLFYKLVVTISRHFADYLLLECWFLSSLAEYDPNSSPRAPFSDIKLSHSAFHFRLWLFHLDFHIHRICLHLQTSNLHLCLTNQSHWLPNSLYTNNPSLIQHLKPPWKIPASVIPPFNTGRYLSILSPPSNPLTSHALRNKITACLHSQHLLLSTVQAQTFLTYNTNTITLFKTIHDLKLYPAILSFS